MAHLHKYRRGGKPSVASLMEQIPDNGCLLVFNAKHRNWRSQASDYKLFVVTKIGPEVIGRGDNDSTTDIMVSWKESYDD